MPVQTHPRILMFLEERDRARVRGDNGVIRSLTADLRRLGVSDQATLANPEGPKHAHNGNGHDAESNGDDAKPQRKGGRPKLPRCEHGAIVGRCLACQDDDDHRDPPESTPEPFSEPSMPAGEDSPADEAAALTGAED